MIDFITYMGANVICVIIFGIMLTHDLLNVDRQEKQIKYDHALVAFMLYFISDSVWAAVMAGVISTTKTSVCIVNISNYCLMFAIIYTWLRYVLAVEQVPNRDSNKMRFSLLFPFAVVTVIMILMYIFAQPMMISDTLEMQTAAYVFLVLVPYFYIFAVMFFTINKARREVNPMERRKHLLVGLFPLVVVFGGIIDMFFGGGRPLFCFCCTILMLVFYIKSMEGRISVDPLTRLNNRGQLAFYCSQKSNLYREGRETFAAILDVNGFKTINDTYGHAEGDRALVIIADSLTGIAKSRSTPMFLCRYGGDEFVIIVHPENDEEIPALVQDIRDELISRSSAAGIPYSITVGVGYDRLQSEDDTIQKCIQRADKKLYIDKRK